MDESKVKDLGVMNSWHCGKDGQGEPVEYQACRAMGHKTTERKLSHCYWEVRCDVCGLKWRYDSSD